jgi:hypothetical protein
VSGGKRDTRTIALPAEQLRHLILMAEYGLEFVQDLVENHGDDGRTDEQANEYVDEFNNAREAVGDAWYELTGEQHTDLPNELERV